MHLSDLHLVSRLEIFLLEMAQPTVVEEGQERISQASVKRGKDSILAEIPSRRFPLCVDIVLIEW